MLALLLCQIPFFNNTHRVYNSHEANKKDTMTLSLMLQFPHRLLHKIRLPNIALQHVTIT